MGDTNGFLKFDRELPSRRAVPVRLKDWREVYDADTPSRMLLRMASAGRAMLRAGITTVRDLGAPTTLVIGGSICFAGAILFARNLPKLKEHIRPIYAKKGI